jgi:hypothetical protein
VVLTVAAEAGTISCNGGTTTITVSATGGTAPYNGTGTYTVRAGAYSYTITDANGCTATVNGTVTEPPALTTSISNNNPQLYFGFSGDQSTTVKAAASGGAAPYKISISMSRPLKCNIITDAGDEVWSATGGTTLNNTCPGYPGGNTASPVSTITGLTAGQAYSVNAILMEDAIVTITVTDANGCITTGTTQIFAEDVRCFSGNNGSEKIAICHKTGSAKNPCVKICVDESNLDEHLAHGDYFGNCTPNCVPPSNTFTKSSQVEAVSDQVQTGQLEVQVRNNPSYRSSAFALTLFSPNRRDAIGLRVMDATGRLITQKQNLRAGQTIEIGEGYVQGFYFAEVMQGRVRKVVKLVKQ